MRDDDKRKRQKKPWQYSIKSVPRDAGGRKPKTETEETLDQRLAEGDDG